MYPHGIIYQAGDPKHGAMRMRASFGKRILYQGIRGVAAGIIAYAIIFFMFTYAPLVQQELSYTLGQKQLEVSDNLVERAKAETTAEVQEEAESYGVGSYFSIVIPKIGAAENVVANVDAGNPTEYLKALETGVAHARGTYFPGQGERIYMFSHSTDSPLNFARYNAVFYLLGKLESGDTIIVFFADKKYVYEVSEKLTTTAGDTSWLSSDSASGPEGLRPGGEELVLQTCDPPGTTWRRLIIVAKPVGGSIDIPNGGI